MPTNSDSEDEVQSKVARLIAVYDLGGEFGDSLEELWTRDSERRESLRSLADRFNKELLSTAMADAGMSALDGEIDNLYRLLTSDDVSSGNRTEGYTRLEQHGVDVEQLEQDFVTYQAIRTYLKEYRDAEYEREGSDKRVDSVMTTIQRLQSRTRSVAEKSLRQLNNTDQISVGKFRVFVEISVLCEDCGTQYGILDFLRERSCNCQSE